MKRVSWRANIRLGELLNSGKHRLDGRSGNQLRDHFAGKLISRLGDVDLEGYVTYDDAREYTYQRVYA